MTGADPAAAMLAVARGRPGGDQVRWIETDAAGLSVPTRFDLVVLTGHVFQLLLGDDDVRAGLDTLGRHLAPGGRIAFETRNPEVREWQYWTPRETQQRIETTAGPADVHYDISSVTGPLVSYETCIRFPDGERVVVPDTLRFMDQAELAGFLPEPAWTTSPGMATGTGHRSAQPALRSSRSLASTPHRPGGTWGQRIRARGALWPWGWRNSP